MPRVISRSIVLSACVVAVAGGAAGATAPPDDPQYEVVRETEVVGWMEAHPDERKFLCSAEAALIAAILDQDLNGVLYPGPIPHIGNSEIVDVELGMLELASRYAIDLTEQRT